MILIYSRSFITHNAISCLCNEMNVENVYCFSDRVKFLTAATLLNHAWIVMDTVISTADDIIWLHGKLRLRTREGNIYYMIKPQEIGNIYSIYLNTVSSIQDMVEFIRMTQVHKNSVNTVSLAESLHRKINTTLCPAHIDLIRHEKTGPSGRSVYVLKHGNRAYLNRRYQLNKKLKLETMQEFHSLMYMLNDKNKLTEKH